MGIQVDMAGDDLYVNNIYSGNSTPGNLTSTVPDQSGIGTSFTTATATLTAGQSGGLFVFNRAAGTTVTLPKPIIGMSFTFAVGTVDTSNTDKIITDASTTFLSGGLFFDKSLTITRYDADGSTIRSINLNGTTTGGASIGDLFTLTCISATEWNVSGTVTASGTLATPFATS